MVLGPYIALMFSAISIILRHLAARCIPDNLTIFATAATTTSLEMHYYRHMDPVQYDAIIYSVHSYLWIAIIHPSHNLDSDLINQSVEWGYWLISVLHISIPIYLLSVILNSCWF